jgi:pyruvate formate lyase activating enzyme
VRKEAILWKALDGKKVECIACARKCRIPEDSHGFCFVRQNIGGKLYLANYGIIDAMQVDPIEKKPFNHFHPGSTVLGIGTSSCNFGCQFCQNHNISKDNEISGMDVSPKEIIGTAERYGAQGIAFTYNEPTIFMEFALDVARLAHKKGMFTTFVTNGYMTIDAVDAMKGLIDAAVVDFKGNGEDKFANRFEMVMSNGPIKEALKRMKRNDIHIEITDLIIPRVGESLEACDSLTRWIHDELGADTPIHFTRFHPDYKMLGYPETSQTALKAHYNIARKNGLNYVYIGNIPGNKYESTYCPKCSALLIEREGFYLKRWLLPEDNTCPKCGTTVPIAGAVILPSHKPKIVSLY